MLDFLKNNIDNVIEFVQEKYGELTGAEVQQIKDEPTQLAGVVKDKFGIDAETLKNDLLSKFGGLGGIFEGLKDKAGDLLGGLTGGAGEAKEGAGNILEGIKDKAGDSLGDLADKAKDLFGKFGK